MKRKNDKNTRYQLSLITGVLSYKVGLRRFCASPLQIGRTGSTLVKSTILVELVEQPKTIVFKTINRAADIFFVKK
jgi:hypothetical protein